MIEMQHDRIVFIPGTSYHGQAQYNGRVSHRVLVARAKAMSNDFEQFFLLKFSA
jgi:hypothetical protein